MSRHKSFLQDNNILNKEITNYPFNKRKTQTKSCIIPHTLKKNYKNHFLSHELVRLAVFLACITPPSLPGLAA